MSMFFFLWLSSICCRLYGLHTKNAESRCGCDRYCIQLGGLDHQLCTLDNRRVLQTSLRPSPFSRSVLSPPKPSCIGKPDQMNLWEIEAQGLIPLFFRRGLLTFGLLSTLHTCTGLVGFADCPHTYLSIYRRCAYY